jgi:putative FmdB family regulatory protein
MPIYEYRCEACSSKFELLTSYAEREQPHSCPRCSSAKTRVLVSSFAFAGGEPELSADLAASGGGCCGGGCGSCGCSIN